MASKTKKEATLEELVTAKKTANEKAAMAVMQKATTDLKALGYRIVVELGLNGDGEFKQGIAIKEIRR